MSTLPDRQPAATVSGQAQDPLTDSVISAAVEHVIEKAKRQGTSPDVIIGNTPPVPQPGVPPMSQQATDIGRVAVFCGLATVPPGLIAIGVLVASEHANPTVIGMVCAAPAALVVPIFAIARLLRGAKDALPAEIHNHYTGTVIQDQRITRTENKGVWVKTTNRP